ncbi:MAG: endolytic transglycosylase MltG [Deltaproteobacteria bacterium]|nr:endolytic transglycosylase MltG [Deltaproteobacteria bacterium]
MLKKKNFLILTILFLVLMAGCFFILDFYRYGSSPAYLSEKKKVFIVKKGQNTNSVTIELLKQGLIREPFKFKLLARIRGLNENIKAGEYLLSPSMTPASVIEKMIKGEVRLRRITVPEGFTIRQIASLINDAGLEQQDVFNRYATDPLLTRQMNIDADTFEGYLFPDTYYFSKGITSKKIISTMLKRFRSVFKTELKKRAQDIGLSVHEIVTLASIIEKETGKPFERPIISSVFHNRLKKKMRLESDPTVIYGISDFNGNITRKDLKRRTPYNTYRKRGLPLGPIANPGAEALKAALYPEDTDYLYFVSKRDSTHQFSTNIRDHNRAVRRYQLLRR